MYRNTFIVVVLFCVFALLNVARADTVATLKNQGGGQIVLTDIKCRTMSGMVAYGTHPNNSTLFGCWFLDDIFVHITWSDGDTRSYPRTAGWYFPNAKPKADM
jgi:hypothetical protein